MFLLKMIGAISSGELSNTVYLNNELNLIG